MMSKPSHLSRFTSHYRRRYSPGERLAGKQKAGFGRLLKAPLMTLSVALSTHPGFLRFTPLTSNHRHCNSKPLHDSWVAVTSLGHLLKFLPVEKELLLLPRPAKDNDAIQACNVQMSPSGSIEVSPPWRLAYWNWKRKASVGCNIIAPDRTI